MKTHKPSTRTDAAKLDRVRTKFYTKVREGVHHSHALGALGQPGRFYVAGYANRNAGIKHFSA